MSMITRREFSAMALLAGAQRHRMPGADSLDDSFRAAVKRHAIPLAAAMVAGSDRTVYAGGCGKRDSASDIDVTVRSIFRIASMTKAVTAVAAMQLVEQGKLGVNQPVARHLPELGKVQVLEGFDKATNKPMLRPARRPILLRHLLTHTAGFAYTIWDRNLVRYTELTGPGEPGAATPLMFEPGSRWEYGTNMDWAGRLVEKVSGQTLEDYFQKNILQPLGMKDTSYILPEDKFERLVSVSQRQEGGAFTEQPRTPPVPPKTFNGGGGLYSTPEDYVRFMQMFLRRGRGADGQPLLRARTVDLMTSDQIGGLQAGILKSCKPETSSDVDFHPGFRDGFGFGFLINAKAYEGGRSAGSLAWAGIDNTFFWIDPRRGICATVMMQFLPFCDTAAMGLLRDFERSVYRT